MVHDISTLKLRLAVWGLLLGVCVIWSGHAQTDTALAKGPWTLYVGKGAFLLRCQTTKTNPAPVLTVWQEKDKNGTQAKIRMTHAGNNIYQALIRTEATAGAYGYELVLGSRSYRGTFRDFSRDPQVPTCLYMVGDTRSLPDQVDAVCKAMLEDREKNPAQRQGIWVHTGDWVVAGRKEKCWQTEFFSPNHPNIARALRYFPLVGCRGNHENDGNLFFRYFPWTSWLGGTEHPNLEPWQRFVYVVDYGHVRIAVADTYIDKAHWPAMTEQLVQALKPGSSPTPLWHILLIHEPIYSAGGHKDSKKSKQLFTALKKAGAQIDLVVAGHNHYYAKCVDDQGLTHLTLGGGGAPVRQPNPNASKYVRKAVKALSFARALATPAAMEIDVLDTKLQVIDQIRLKR